MTVVAYLRAFSTLGCPELTLEQAVAFARAHGWGGVELRTLAGTLDLPGHFRKNYGTPETLAGNLRGETVKIVSLDTSLRLADNTAADRDALMEFVPWAEKLGVPHLRVFDGGRTAEAEELGRAAATVNWWREQRTAGGWNVDLMVETHDSLLTSGKIARFLGACPGTKILWDAHHTWRQGGEDPVVTWRQIGRHVPHIHVKDSVSRGPGQAPYAYVPPGEGEFPAGELFGVLRREFGGVVSLEWERQWHPHLPPLEVALRAAAASGW